MKNEQFIPNKVDPFDSDDSSIHEDLTNGIQTIVELSDSETPENVTDDSSSHFSPESDNESAIESETSADDEDDNSSDDNSNLTDPSKIDTDDRDTLENSKQEENLLTEPSSDTKDDNCDTTSNSLTNPKQINTEEAGYSKLNDNPSTSKDETDGADMDSDWESTGSGDINMNMEEFFGIRTNQEAVKNHPPDLKASSAILDVCFSPVNDTIATGTIDGDVVIYSYNTEEVKEVSRLSHHKTSCRQLCFSEDGALLYTVSKDQSLAVIDVERSTPKLHLQNAHRAPIYCFLEVDKNRCATGDDDGMVKLWDLRQSKAIFSFSCSDETITSLLVCERKKFLSATVADGSLTGFNLSKNRIESQSEMFESEYTCQSLVKRESRLVVGTGSGSLQIFQWGHFGYKVDALSGHPDMVLCQGAITDNIIFTGCEDGMIRAVHLYPHKFLGVVGQHKDYGVENLTVSHDGTYLASCSKEDVFFWNVDYLYDWKKPLGKKKNKRKSDTWVYNMPSSRQRNRKDFFRDIPLTMESDDDEGGPVTGTGYQSD